MPDHHTAPHTTSNKKRERKKNHIKHTQTRQTEEEKKNWICGYDHLLEIDHQPKKHNENGHNYASDINNSKFSWKEEKKNSFLFNYPNFDIQIDLRELRIANWKSSTINKTKMWKDVQPDIGPIGSDHFHSTYFWINFQMRWISKWFLVYFPGLRSACSHSIIAFLLNN